MTARPNGLTDSSGFDFARVLPEYVATLELPEPTILQGFAVDEGTDEIYATQVVPSPAGTAESFRLCRLTPGGRLLDSMLLLYGGHGTTIGLQNLDGDVLVWSQFDRVDPHGTSVGQDLVRFRYTPGTTLDPDSQALTRLDRFSDGHFRVVLDEKTSTLALWNVLPDAGNRVEVRGIADVVAGVDRLIAAIDIPDELVEGSREWTQGIALDGTDLYWYLGDGQLSFPTEILRFDLRSGLLTARQQVDLRRALGDRAQDGYQEPEGVHLYTSRDGHKSLLLGVVTGGVGRRIRMLYGFHDGPENAARFTSA